MHPDARAQIQQVLLGDALEWASELAAFVLDESGRYIAVNDAGCELAGLPREEILGAAVGAFHPHLVAEFSAVMSEGRRGGETHLERADGTRVEFGYRVSGTKVGGLPYFVVVCWTA